MEVKGGPERNISVWPKLKINLWGITKTGHTSLKNHLYMLENNTKNNFDLNIHGKKNTTYITADEANTNGNQNICMVRNPIDRFKSGYNDFFNTRKDKGNKIAMRHNIEINGIDDLLNVIKHLDDVSIDPHFRRQSWYLENFKGMTQKLEDIETDWRLPIKPMLLKQNVTNSEDINLNQEQIEIIKYVYKKDFELLNYVAV